MPTARAVLAVLAVGALPLALGNAAGATLPRGPARRISAASALRAAVCSVVAAVLWAALAPRGAALIDTGVDALLRGFSLLVLEAAMIGTVCQASHVPGRAKVRLYGRRAHTLRPPPAR